MSGHRHPPLRLPTLLDGNGVPFVQDAVVVDVPLHNKFGIAWPDDQGSTSQSQSRAQSEYSGSIDLSDIEDDDGDEAKSPSSEAHRMNNGSSSVYDRSRQSHGSKPTPQLSRALSTPLPGELGHLKNPYRNGHTLPPASPAHVEETFHLRELSVELADSVQTIVQTLLQVSPPQVLEPTKEQFSACSLSVPTSSISAMLTAMKNLNYMSANISTLFSNSAADSKDQYSSTIGDSSNVLDDFDIGEMLQNVGDSLSGAAAQAGVDLVLFHEDVGMKHVSVRGIEGGISYVLSHIVRQIINTTLRGDSIEIGLSITDSSVSEDFASGIESDMIPSIPVEGPLRCTFDIAHKFAPSDIMPDDQAEAGNSTQEPTRPKPRFDTLLLCRLLQQIGAQLTTDLPPKSFPLGRANEFTVILERGRPTPPEGLLARQMDGSTREPTLEELSQFAETIRGKKVMLYASSNGSFAHHLTSYLTAWGMDISHASSEPEVIVSPTEIASTRQSPEIASRSPYGISEGAAVLDVTQPKSDSNNSLSFVFVDDDVSVLRQKLKELRSEHATRFNSTIRRRPSLVANHRPRSTNQMPRAVGLKEAGNLSQPQVTVVHFTSLANYKVVWDVTQSIVATYAGVPVPEILIIPKPAGPRRVLTALHTAITRPVVDSFFTPIATSPASPVLQSRPSYTGSLGGSELKLSPTSSRPNGSRSNSDRSNKSTKEREFTPQPTSPLAAVETMEYFSDVSVKLGSSPASGLMIQSPDGQPAGIFFHPRSKSNRTPSAHKMERDYGQLGLDRGTPIGARRASDERRATTPSAMSFSTLHASSPSPKPFRQTVGYSGEIPGSPVIQAPTPVAGAEGSVGDGEGSPLKAGGSTLRRLSANAVGVRKLTSTPPRSPQREDGEQAVLGSSQPGQTPVKKGSLDKPKTPTAKRSKGSTETKIVPPISVLIVDDNPINQTILSTFMKKKKIKYDVANNGQEAVQKWKTGGFHLILMDILMPIMDGIQATKEIRSLERQNASAGYPPSTPQSEGQRTPSKTPSETWEARSATSPYRSAVIIVALTASSLQSDRVNALAAGCNDFLTKPVSLLWLNNKIIEWGSIKALQMWADLRPDMDRAVSSGQAVQARAVAERLHVPEKKSMPSPSRALPAVWDEVSPVVCTPTSNAGGGFWEPGHSSPPFLQHVAGVVGSSPHNRRTSTESKAGIEEVSAGTSLGATTEAEKEKEITTLEDSLSASESFVTASETLP